MRQRRSRSAGGGPPWNGRDFYVVLGNVRQGADRWNLAVEYRFVGAGGGSWYWKPLRNLSPGKRVFAYVGGAGYVGVGEVTGPMVPLREFEVDVEGDGVPVVGRPDVPERIRTRALSSDPEQTEFAVPVRWFVARPLEEAVFDRGLFATQVTACKLRHQRTIEVVTAAFAVASGPD